MHTLLKLFTISFTVASFITCLAYATSPLLSIPQFSVNVSAVDLCDTMSLRELMASIPSLKLERLFYIESILDHGIHRKANINHVKYLQRKMVKAQNSIKRYADAIAVRQGWYRSFWNDDTWFELNNQTYEHLNEVCSHISTYFREVTRRNKSLSTLLGLSKQIKNTVDHVIRLEDQIMSREEALKVESATN